MFWGCDESWFLLQYDGSVFLKHENKDPSSPYEFRLVMVMKWCGAHLSSYNQVIMV